MPAEMPAKQQREQQRGLSAFPRLAVFVVGLVLVLVVAGLIRSILPKRLSNTVSGFTGDFRGNVAVGVHGQRDLAVTEDFHDDAGTPKVRGRSPGLATWSRRRLRHRWLGVSH